MKKKVDKFELLAISEPAQEMAERIKAKMEDAGLYKPEYHHIIELLAETIFNYNRCLNVVHTVGFAEETEKGGMKTLPEASMMLQLGIQIKGLSEQLLLTPKTGGVGNRIKDADPVADLMGNTPILTRVK